MCFKTQLYVEPYTSGAGRRGGDALELVMNWKSDTRLMLSIISVRPACSHNTAMTALLHSHTLSQFVPLSQRGHSEVVPKPQRLKD